MRLICTSPVTKSTLALEGLRGLVVLDEVQARPQLFSILRVLADRPRKPARFLVLGSTTPDLLRQGAETLAGRIAFRELGGFDLEEVGANRLDRLWFRGGFPRSSRMGPLGFSPAVRALLSEARFRMMDSILTSAYRGGDPGGSEKPGIRVR